MRGVHWLFLAGLVGGLGPGLAAQAPVPIVGVIRKGEPPYAPGDQVYVLGGGLAQGLQPGLRLRVRRPGEARVLGWLVVTEAAQGRAEAHLEREGPTYLMKGDLAWRQELEALPVIPPPAAARIPAPPALPSGAEAPPWEGLLFFLPQRDDLSPAGQRKLAEWVGAWGASGRWVVQVPTARGLSADLQHRRTATLKAALTALGARDIAVDTAPRKADGKYDPAWIRHWNRMPNKTPRNRGVLLGTLRAAWVRRAAASRPARRSWGPPPRRAGSRAASGWHRRSPASRRRSGPRRGPPAHRGGPACW